MGVTKIEQFLTHLAVEGRAAASTQNQAFSALLFLYREVLHIELPESIYTIRAAHIDKRIGCHTFRPSFATHLW